MIKQVLDVNNKWKVIVYYNINYNLFAHIATDLYHIETHTEQLKRIYHKMITGRAKAVTISNSKYKTSIVLFNKHKHKYDYANSIVHEAEHVKQAMLKYYDIDDSGEAPAYTMGYLVMKFFMFLHVLK